MRLWKVIIQNLIADSILALGAGCATIATVLLGSQILMDLTGNK